MYRLSIDPGVRGLGLAIFDDEKLVWALYLGGSERTAPERLADLIIWVIPVAFTPKEAVVEKMQVYSLSSQKGDQNDLIDLSEVVGAVRHALFASGVTVRALRPREWKGQIPKHVTRARVDRELSIEETSRVQWPPTAKLRQDVYDAIHLGLREFTTRPV